MLLLQRVQPANFRSWRDSSAGFQTFCSISLVVFSLFDDASFSERIGFLVRMTLPLFRYGSLESGVKVYEGLPEEIGSGVA